MTRIHFSFDDHVMDFNAALSASATKGDPRTALSSLHADGLAQVMSFVGQFSLTRYVRTLHAVSPQVRLDAEALKRQPQLCEDFHRVRVQDDQLVYGIAAVEQSRSRVRLERSLWWAKRCGLPLVLEVDNARSDVLAQLSDTLGSCIVALRVQVSSTSTCMRAAALPCGGECGSFLCALCAFPHLQQLSISCRTSDDDGLLVASINRSLQCAAHTNISEVELRGFTQLENFSSLSGSDQLTHLLAKHCGMQSLPGLLSCSTLTVLDVSNNQRLQSLADLAGARRLKRLYARSCDLRTLDGLSTCLQLSVLDVSSNRLLENFAGVTGAPCLESLSASCCGLRDVDGLNRCPWLAELDVSYNKLLQSLRGLSGAPCLAVLRASGCELRDLEGLGSCSRLHELNVSSNRALEDLVGLSGAPRLRKINAVSCGLRRVDGLNNCPLLVEFVAHYNGTLETLGGLAGAPCLERVTAWNCGLRSVDGLSTCPRLCELELSGNPFLRDLRDLASSTSLKRLTVSAGQVSDTLFFDPSIKVTV